MTNCFQNTAKPFQVYLHISFHPDHIIYWALFMEKTVVLEFHIHETSLVGPSNPQKPICSLDVASLYMHARCTELNGRHRML